MKEQFNEAVDSDSMEICSRKDAAAFLKVSVSFLDNCTKDIIPRIKIGRRTMYMKSDLIDFILSSKSLGAKKCKTKSQKMQEQNQEMTSSNK